MSTLYEVGNVLDRRHTFCPPNRFDNLIAPLLWPSIGPSVDSQVKA
jgi:hypothetical protein